MAHLIKRFEHPEMENPVYKLDITHNSTIYTFYIQRMELNDYDEWRAVIKVGNFWEQNTDIPFLGFTKKEAIDRLIAKVEYQALNT